MRWGGLLYPCGNPTFPQFWTFLLAGARDLQTKGLIESSMSENRISALLNQHMRAARMASNSSDILSWFMRTVVPDDSVPSLGLVEPDFLFTWGPYPSRDDPSLFVEAKRLRGAYPYLATEYVDKGVMRFVNGSYGKRSRLWNHDGIRPAGTHI